MDLLEAVRKLNKLRDDADKIDNWVAELQFGDKDKRKPVNGHNWFRLEKAIRGVVADILDEHDELEERINKVTKDIKIT